MSLLTLIQEAAGSLNQPVPSVIVGSSLGDAVLWRNLAQREGRELARRHDWQELTIGVNMTTVAAQQQDPLPTDFDRFPVDTEIWNTTLGQKYYGPTDMSEWNRLTITSTLSYQPGAWQLRNGLLLITPAPTAGETINFKYVSKDFCEASDGTNQSEWLADSDVALIPEHLISLGITWRWLRVNGMDYAEEMSTYEREVEKATSRNRGMKIMVVGGSHSDDQPPTTWDGTITP